MKDKNQPNEQSRLQALEERIKALEKRNQLYENIFDQLPYGMQFYAPNGQLEYQNKVAQTFSDSAENGGRDLLASQKNGQDQLFEQAKQGKKITREFEVSQNGRAPEAKDKKARRVLEETLFPVKQPDASGSYIVSVLEDKTQEREMQASLKSSERNFRLLFESSPLGTYIATPQGKILDGNPALLQMLGSPSIEATKQFNVLEFPPLVENGYAEIFKQCVREKIIRFIEIEYTSKWGKSAWYSSYIIPLTNDQNEVESVYTLMENITDRKNAEEALKESEAWYRQLADLTFEGIIIHNNGIAKSVNRAFLQMFGYTQEEILGKNVVDLVMHPKDHEKIWQNVAKHVARPYEVTGITKEGSHINLELEARNVKIGNRLSRVAAVRNITERKKAEQAIKDREEKFRSFVDNSVDAIRLVDEEGKIIFVNESHYTLTGYKKSEVEGKYIWDFLYGAIPEEKQTPGRYQKMKDTIQRVMHSNFNKYLGARAVKAKTKSGKIIETHEAIFKFSTSQGKRFGSIIRDITQMKQQEKELQELIATRDKFFNIIAHDLRNPFNTILGFSEILKKSAEDSDSSRTRLYAEKVHRSAKRTYELINDLLQWSRLQTGKMQFQADNIRLCTVVSHVEELLKASLEQKQLQLENHFPPEMQLYADRFMLETILRNLISNAIKYSYNQKLIRIHATEHARETVIAVEDQGVGIDPEKIDALFQIDNQFTTPGTQNEVGSGLGLMLCKEFVEKHGGRIWAESEPEKGSVFLFSLPHQSGRKVAENS